MFVSLFDISFLTSLPCTGEEINTLLGMSSGVEYDPKYPKPLFLAFVKSTYDPSKPTSTKEHISFMLTLIYRYMICFSSKSSTKEFILLTITLAHDRHLALDPFLLAYFYRSYQDVIAYPLGNNGELL